MIIQPAYARAGLAEQTTLSLGRGVTYSTYLESSPRNIVNVTRISAGAPFPIVAVAAPANERGETLAPVASLCRAVGGVACINGDFFGPTGVPLGGELIAGQWVRAPTSTQQQLWLNSGSQFSLGAVPPYARYSVGATKYAILLPGRPIAIPEHDDFADGAYARTLVGWDGAGDRFFVTVEAGGASHGMSLAQAAALMQQLGATTAINEDGGGSSQMVVDGVVHTSPGVAPRAVDNIWAIVG